MTLSQVTRIIDSVHQLQHPQVIRENDLLVKFGIVGAAVDVIAIGLLLHPDIIEVHTTQNTTVLSQLVLKLSINRCITSHTRRRN